MESIGIDKLCLNILGNFPEGIIVLDEHLKCKYINKTAEKYLCITGEEYIGCDIQDLGFSKKVKESCLKVLQIKKPENCECKLSDIIDNNCIYKLNISLIQNYLLIKIEEQKGLIEETISNSPLEDMLSIFLRIGYPVFFKGKDFKYRAVNQLFADLFNLSKEELVGKGFEDLCKFTPMIFEKFNEVILAQQRILAGEIDKYSIELEFGDLYWKVIIFPMKYKEIINGIGGIVFNISELSEKNNELNLLSEAINHLAEGVLITNSEGVIQYVNPTYEKLTGYSLKEFRGKTPAILSSGKHSEKFYKALWKKIRNKNIWEGVFINRKKDGTCYNEKAAIFPVLNIDSEITNFVAIKRDITHEEELEEQLRQSQKMESIGRLAGGIAHDFNNIITVILGYTELLLSQTEKTESSYRPLAEIKKSSKRAVELTRHLLTFSRKQIFQMKRVDINKIVTNMTNMLQRIIGENINLNLKFQNENLPILSNVSMIEQIAMNMVINARDALEGKKSGNITIETSTVSIAQIIKDGDFDAKPGRYALIKIKDNGTGMSEETRRLVFEPFFTTKQPSSGTGLGLSTVYGIVKQHNGFIRIDSELGKGTTFNIYLPYGNFNVAEQTVTQTTGIIEEGGGLILILEDEESLLELLEAAFINAGYSVLTATSSFEVYKKLPDGGVDLLLADIMLKGERGDELAIELKKKYKNMKVLLMSGYANKLNLSSDCFGIAGCEFIQKPFTIAQITKKIRMMLTGEEENVEL